MGYNYRESGYGRCDYLIVTKKGKEEGRLPDGIVILTGQLYADPEFKAWLPTAEEKGYHGVCCQTLRRRKRIYSYQKK